MESTSASSSRYATRISAACSICRAKKRKCSGEKPICAECKSLNLPCEWPKQMKRGPAKHYVRTLEARLRRTEVLLRNLLPFVSDDQLSYVLREDGPLRPSGTSQGADSGERADPELWQIYPLIHAEDVRAWQSDNRTPSTAMLLPVLSPEHAGDDSHDQSQGDIPHASMQRRRHTNGSLPDATLRHHGNRMSISSSVMSNPSSTSHVPPPPHSLSPGHDHDPSSVDHFYPPQQPYGHHPTTLPGGEQGGYAEMSQQERMSWSGGDPKNMMGIGDGSEDMQQQQQQQPRQESLNFLPISFQKEFLW